MCKNPSDTSLIKNVYWVLPCTRTSQVALVVKNLPANAGDIKGSDLIPGSGSFPEEDMAIHSSILAWRIPWTEEPGRLQSTGSQSVRHDWSDLAHTMHHVPGTKISPWHVQHAFLFFSKWGIASRWSCDSFQWTAKGLSHTYTYNRSYLAIATTLGQTDRQNASQPRWPRHKVTWADANQK